MEVAKKSKIKYSPSNKPNVRSLSNLFSRYYEKEKDYFVDNLALLLSTGLDLKTILISLRAEFRSKGMQEVVDYILLQIDNGSELWRALEELEIFPDFVISLVKIGEASAKLNENFQVISIQRKKELALKSKIQSAAAYPLFVLTISFLVLIGISWFILPNLANIFASMDVELPFLTVILINIGEFMALYGSIFVPALFITLFLLIYFLFINKSTKFIGQYFLFSIPFLASYFREIEVSKLGFYLGTLLNSGVPISEALDSLNQVASFQPYEKIYLFINEKIREGYSFSKCFEEYPNIDKYIPPIAKNIIVSGELSGNLPKSLLSIGEIYEDRTDNTTKNLTIILEPLLLIFVWIAVAVLAIGVVLPVYSFIGGIGDSAAVQNSDISSQSPTPSVEASPIPTDIVNQPSPTSTTIATTTEIPTPTAITTPEIAGKIEVIQISTGFVNIRQNPSTASKILKQAKSQETYDYIKLEKGWYQIYIDETQLGWISAQYVTVQ